MKVYLSGPISADNSAGTNNWRNFATQYLAFAGHRAIDPCRRKGLYNPKTFTPNEIIVRDLRDVAESDIILLNYQLLPGHLPIGTPCEMMYAWDRNIPIIVVAQDARIREHPWVRAFAVKIFTDLDDALDYLVNFWGC